MRTQGCRMPRWVQLCGAQTKHTPVRMVLIGRVDVSLRSHAKDTAMTQSVTGVDLNSQPHLRTPFWFGMAERGVFPDWMLRLGIRVLLGLRLREAGYGGIEGVNGATSGLGGSPAQTVLFPLRCSNLSVTTQPFSVDCRNGGGVRPFCSSMSPATGALPIRLTHRVQPTG